MANLSKLHVRGAWHNDQTGGFDLVCEDHGIVEHDGFVPDSDDVLPLLALIELAGKHLREQHG